MNSKLFFKHLSLLLGLFAFCLLPDLAFAGGIDEFAAPLQKVVDTITGPVGMSISILMVAISAITLYLNKDNLDGAFKALIQLAMLISMIAFASGIVSSMFSFSSGALI